MPHCSLLSKPFIAHINIEFYSVVKAIQYIYKYMYEGFDTAMFRLEDANSWNEVRLYHMADTLASTRKIGDV